jgi:hypothetical protein
MELLSGLLKFYGATMADQLRGNHLKTLTETCEHTSFQAFQGYRYLQQ